MTPSEVMEIMRRAWENNAPMLRLLYSNGSLAKAQTSKRLQAGKAAASDAFQAMHAMFFVQTLPVAPNRVRPLQYVNGIAFEHPHNIALAKVRVMQRANRNNRGP